MPAISRRIAVSLVILAIWVAITVLGGSWLAGGREELTEGISKSIAWNILAAALFIAGAIAVSGWKDMRFSAPLPGSLKPLWFPALYLAGFYSMAMVSGLPPVQSLALVLINTLMVGLSEEGMFRGVIYRALRASHGIWASVAVSSILFGSVHLLNAFSTGHVLQSFMQAFVASLSGVVFVAILLRTGSILVSILYHALWDFGLFTVANAGNGAIDQAADLPGALSYLAPLLLVLPNFLYALWLLKNLPKHPDAMALA